MNFNEKLKLRKVLNEWNVLKGNNSSKANILYNHTTSLQEINKCNPIEYDQWRKIGLCWKWSRHDGHSDADKLVQCENRMATLIKKNKELEGILLIHLSNFGAVSGIYIYTFKICHYQPVSLQLRKRCQFDQWLIHFVKSTKVEKLVWFQLSSHFWTKNLLLWVQYPVENVFLP